MMFSSFLVPNLRGSSVSCHRILLLVWWWTHVHKIW